MEDFAKLLPKFLRQNTIPIICHQESDAEYLACIRSLDLYSHPSCMHLLHTQVGAKEHDYFGLKSWSLIQVLKNTPAIIQAKYHFSGNNKHKKKKGVNEHIEMSVFVVANGSVVKSSVFSNKVKRYAKTFLRNNKF